MTPDPRVCAFCARMTASASHPLYYDRIEGDRTTRTSIPPGAEGIRVATGLALGGVELIAPGGFGVMPWFAVTTVDGFEVCGQHVYDAWDRSDATPRRWSR
jgi:hypothetical protein